MFSKCQNSPSSSQISSFSYDLASLLTKGTKGNIALPLFRNFRARPYFLAASVSYLSAKIPSKDSHREHSRTQDLKYTRNGHIMAPVNGLDKRSSKMHSKVVSTDGAWGLGHRKLAECIHYWCAWIGGHWIRTCRSHCSDLPCAGESEACDVRGFHGERLCVRWTTHDDHRWYVNKSSSQQWNRLSNAFS